MVKRSENEAMLRCYSHRTFPLESVHPVISFQNLPRWLWRKYAVYREISPASYDGSQQAEAILQRFDELPRIIWPAITWYVPLVHTDDEAKCLWERKSFFLTFLLVCPPFSPFYFQSPASPFFLVHLSQHFSLHLQSIYYFKTEIFIYILRKSSSF